MNQKHPPRLRIVYSRPDFSAKSTFKLIGDIFSSIRDYIRRPGPVIHMRVELDGRLFQKLEPYLVEIAKRARMKTLDVRAYLYGAADAIPESRGKDLYEAAADRLTAEISTTTSPKSGSPHYSKLSYVTRRSQKEESDFSDQLLTGTLKKLLAEKKAKQA